MSRLDPLGHGHRYHPQHTTNRSRRRRPRWRCRDQRSSGTTHPSPLRASACWASGLRCPSQHS